MEAACNRPWPTCLELPRNWLFPPASAGPGCAGSPVLFSDLHSNLCFPVWIDYLTEAQESFAYSGYKSYERMFCKYFLLLSCLSFHFLNGVFELLKFYTLMFSGSFFSDLYHLCSCSSGPQTEVCDPLRVNSCVKCGPSVCFACGCPNCPSTIY